MTSQEVVRSRRLYNHGPFGELIKHERAKWKTILEEQDEGSIWAEPDMDHIQKHDDYNKSNDMEYNQAIDDIEAILDTAEHKEPLPAPHDVVREATQNQWSRVRTMFKVNQWPQRMQNAYAKLTTAAHKSSGKRECVREALLYEDTWVIFFVIWVFFLVIICLIRYIK
jgi:hypothetical protein